MRVMLMVLVWVRLRIVRALLLGVGLRVMVERSLSGLACNERANNERRKKRRRIGGTEVGIPIRDIFSGAKSISARRTKSTLESLSQTRSGHHV